MSRVWRGLRFWGNNDANDSDDDTIKEEMDTRDIFDPETSEERRIRNYQQAYADLHWNPLRIALVRAIPFLILFPIVAYVIIHFSGVLDNNDNDNNDSGGIPANSTTPTGWETILSLRSSPRNPQTLQLSLNGEVLAIGTPTLPRKCVRVYGLEPFTGKGDPICHEDPQTLFFASPLALSQNGNVLAAGVTLNASSRVVSVFGYTPSLDTWQRRGVDLTPDNNKPSEDYGTVLSVSSDGTRLAVGSPQRNTGSYVQVYTYHNSSWSKHGNTIRNDAFMFGSAVSISDNDLLAVGSPFEMTGGLVMVYHLDSQRNVWTPLGNPVLGQDYDQVFGFSLDLSSSSSSSSSPVLAVGSNALSGKAYLFRLNETTETLNTTTTNNNTTNGTTPTTTTTKMEWLPEQCIETGLSAPTEVALANGFVAIGTIRGSKVVHVDSGASTDLGPAFEIDIGVSYRLGVVRAATYGRPESTQFLDVYQQELAAF